MAQFDRSSLTNRFVDGYLVRQQDMQDIFDSHFNLIDDDGVLDNSGWIMYRHTISEGFSESSISDTFGDNLLNDEFKSFSHFYSVPNNVNELNGLIISYSDRILLGSVVTNNFSYQLKHFSGTSNLPLGRFLLEPEDEIEGTLFATNEGGLTVAGSEFRALSFNFLEELNFLYFSFEQENELQLTNPIITIGFLFK